MKMEYIYERWTMSKLLRNTLHFKIVTSLETAKEKEKEEGRSR